MGKKVLVVGDVILDEYTHGVPIGLSSETPTIVAQQIEVKNFVGGAGLVVRHLLRLGCEVTLLTIGSNAEDSACNFMLESNDPISQKEGRNLSDMSFYIPYWNFSRKRRFFIDSYKVAQFDVLSSSKMNSELEHALLERYLWIAKNMDAIVICDNHHGVMNQTMARTMIDYKSDFKLPDIFVDVQISQKNEGRHNWYAGADYMLMNIKEFDAVYSTISDCYPHVDPSDLEPQIKILNKSLDTTVILKVGPLGSIAQIGDAYLEIPAPSVKVVDTCGAGDAFLAALVASERKDWSKRFQDANAWAARSTTYLGTIVPKASK